MIFTKMMELEEKIKKERVKLYLDRGWESLKKKNKFKLYKPKKLSISRQSTGDYKLLNEIAGTGDFPTFINHISKTVNQKHEDENGTKRNKKRSVTIVEAFEMD